MRRQVRGVRGGGAPATGSCTPQPSKPALPLSPSKVSIDCAPIMHQACGWQAYCPLESPGELLNSPCPGASQTNQISPCGRAEASRPAPDFSVRQRSHSIDKSCHGVAPVIFAMVPRGIWGWSPS